MCAMLQTTIGIEDITLHHQCRISHFGQFLTFIIVSMSADALYASFNGCKFVRSMVNTSLH